MRVASVLCEAMRTDLLRLCGTDLRGHVDKHLLTLLGAVAADLVHRVVRRDRQAHLLGLRMHQHGVRRDIVLQDTCKQAGERKLDATV